MTWSPLTTPEITKQNQKKQNPSMAVTESSMAGSSQDRENFTEPSLGFANP
jgi:hypothetical protein